MRFEIPSLDDPNAHPRLVRRAVGHRAAAVRQAYRDHKACIRPLLPPSVQQLQETELHDALFRSLRIDTGRRILQLRLLCDDREHGNFDLDLDYRDIALTDQEMSLLCLLAHVDAEIAWGEVDLDEGADPPTFIHRIRWVTGVHTDREQFEGEWSKFYLLHPEIELRFGGLEIEMALRPDRKRVRTEEFITIVRDPDKIAGME